MPTLPKAYILGIAEKPQAARRLAYALDEGRSPSRIKVNNIPVYLCSRNSNKIVIAPALGHLFSLNQVGKTWQYPTLDFEWLPTHLINKKSKTKNFILAFQELAKNAKEIIVMTDFDREGEVIGFLILKLILNRTKCSRMKFSTLTVRDILKAYKNKIQELDEGFLNSGLLRHYVDWLFGINFSRALTLSLLRTSNKFKTISIGRVQGPTLRFVVNRENEINLFVPIPYWKVFGKIKLKNEEYHKVEYSVNKIEILDDVNSIINDCSKHQGQVKNILEKEEIVNPFPPFNLSDLQREAYKIFKFSPSKTLEIAEKLYLNALISYPRTDSQKLPMSLGHKSILSKLSEQSVYTTFVNEIMMRQKYKPYEGKKDDAAHPAIHPTGNNPPSTITKQEMQLYDLIVRRYLSVFGEKAKRHIVNIEISVGSHVFITSGYSVVHKGWTKYYAPYFTLQERDVPNLKIGDIVYFEDVYSIQYYTQPPNRYNEATLLKKMEDEKLGTKATRATIIKTLFDRGYIQGKIITPTLLGKAVIRVLEEHYPTLVYPEMTRYLEDLMNKITNKKVNIDDILLQIKFQLKKLLIEFHKKEAQVGISLYEKIVQERKEQVLELGKCPKCGKGILRVVRSKKSGKRFVACSSYNDPNIKCDLTFPLPNSGKLYVTKKKCPHDNLPILEWEFKNRIRHICINPDCKSRGETKNV
ncbi:MAG: DNA topoisomerase I [Candidatus Heimdallarchaeaceae archaeon]